MSDPLDIPTLTDGTVTLRPHTMEDVDAVLERCLDPVTQRWTTVPLGYTREMAVEYVEGLTKPSPDGISWAIEFDGWYAGTIDLRGMGTGEDDRQRIGNLGFVTHQDVRGRGVMSQAIGLVVAHAFDVLGWQTVLWQGNVGNIGSYKSAWRNGFPVPVLVPALLPHRGELIDGWHSPLHRDDTREPVKPWDEVLPVLEEQARLARHPG